MKKNIFIATIYLCFAFGALYFLNIWVHLNLFKEKNFLNFDAANYQLIMKNGYSGHQFICAFFPFFPLIWKLTGLTTFGIILLNVLIFLSSLFILSKYLKSGHKEILIFLTLPSIIFIFLPFSESVFFFSSVMILIGLRKNNLFAVVGFFLATLSRPAFTVLIPALLITEILTSKINKQFIYRICLYLLAICVGILIVGLIQYSSSGRWFEFFEAQKLWNNHLQIPILPLTTWGGDNIVRLDATAFLIGVVCAIILLKMFFTFYKKRILYTEKEFIFSACYVAGISLLVLAFRGGSLFSLNRFVFCTPFFFVLLNKLLNIKFHFTTRNYILSLISLQIFWLLFGSYVHIQVILIFLAISIYILLYPFLINRNNLIKIISFYLIILLNIFLQLYFYIHSLQGGWVG